MINHYFRGQKIFSSVFEPLSERVQNSVRTSQYIFPALSHVYRLRFGRRLLQASHETCTKQARTNLVSQPFVTLIKFTKKCHAVLALILLHGILRILRQKFYFLTQKFSNLKIFIFEKFRIFEIIITSILTRKSGSARSHLHFSDPYNNYLIMFITSAKTIKICTSS